MIFSPGGMSLWKDDLVIDTVHEHHAVFSFPSCLCESLHEDSAPTYHVHDNHDKHSVKSHCA